MERSPEKRGLASRASWLVGATMAYNVVEAGIAIWAALQAGSIALLGFGLDSVIEIAAAAFMLWRLRVELAAHDEESIETAEKRVQRIIGVTFFLLAIYVTVEAALTLASRSEAGESIVGIVVAAASLVVMPLLAWAKLRVADRLGSGALRSEAKETLACAFLSVTLLVGLALNAAFGWWWADPVAALVMVPWLVKEGLEGVRGEGERDD